MNLIILHLSDIHIRGSQDVVLKRAEAIGRSTFKDLSQSDGVAVLITGDIAFSGKIEQYKSAKEFIDQIVDTIRYERNIPIDVLMCPGNHDCDLDDGNQDVRDIVIEKVRKTPPDEIKESLIDTCSAVQNNFFEFRDQFKIRGESGGDKLWRTYKLPVGDHTVVLHCLNVAWMSMLKEAPGVIAFPTKRYEPAAKTESDTTIVCMHHPLNWFSQPSYRPFRQLIRKAAHVILTGHEHVQSAAFIDDTDSGETVAIDGGVLQGDNVADSKFNVIFLDLEKQEYSVNFHEWDGERYVPVELESTWSSFKRLPKKQQSGFDIAPEFSQWLNDAGARFTHHGKTTDLVLDDVYVFPELRPLTDDEKGRDVVDSANMLSPTNLERGVLIKGREQYGKTSLLKQLFRSYHERGFIPVVLSGKELTKSTPRELGKTIDSSVSKIYGKSDLAKFWQAGVERRVLLLDDLDDTPLSGSYLSNALEYLSANFALMVVTTCEMFELRELIATKGEDILRKLEHYEMLEFGHRLRLELIKRWARFGEPTYSLERMVSFIDHTEKLVTNVIGEGVVPSNPFFLLTLLQSIEAGSTTNLQQSALGDYYRYLIVHSLEVQKVAREEHNEILNYCAFLSWFLYQAAEPSVPLTEFESFHEAFIKRHGLSIKSEDRKSLLLSTRLIEEQDGGYGFRYPYLYYFFLGKYLAEHLADQEVQQVVRECCQALYRQDNGNIVLFLAHHTRDARVYESVLSVLQGHYRGLAPMALDADIDVVNRLVEAAPQLVFVDGDVLQNREETRKQQDESSEAKKTFLEHTDSLPAVIVELMSLLRTIDILGQFLKNHYGQLEADIKEILLSELFEGGLRGLRHLFELLLHNSDGLISSIESVLEKRGLEDDPIRRNERAKREMYWLLSLIAFGFIHRCGLSVASPHLVRVLDNVVDNNPTKAFQLIHSVVYLEKQGGINDMTMLRLLNKEIKSSALAQSVLQQMVLRHMHLYATTGYQKQKVCAELNIRMQDQRAIDVKTRGSKRI